MKIIKRIGDAGMQTLHEYMMETKATEYILAVIFLATFIVFWRFVRVERK
ncbi:MAG: hypothetical protein JSV91_03650 [Phycisphaerales bacterium]|nr:MAG: hypothetical protein JSV91_03650 [Phycisphaerales bacterium]